MSITVTTDVFCDAPDCRAWIHGVTGPRVDARDARRVAREYGWKRVHTSAGTLEDHCPEHDRAQVADQPDPADHPWAASGGEGTATIVSRIGGPAFAVHRHGQPDIGIAEAVAAALNQAPWDLDPTCPGGRPAGPRPQETPMTDHGGVLAPFVQCDHEAAGGGHCTRRADHSYAEDPRSHNWCYCDETPCYMLAVVAGVDPVSPLRAEVSDLRAAVAAANQRADRAEAERDTLRLAHRTMVDAHALVSARLTAARRVIQKAEGWWQDMDDQPWSDGDLVAIRKATEAADERALVADQPPAGCHTTSEPCNCGLGGCWWNDHSPALVADQPTTPDPAWPDETRRQPDQEHT